MGENTSPGSRTIEISRGVQEKLAKVEKGFSLLKISVPRLTRSQSSCRAGIQQPRAKGLLSGGHSWRKDSQLLKFCQTYHANRPIGNGCFFAGEMRHRPVNFILGVRRVIENKHSGVRRVIESKHSDSLIAIWYCYNSQVWNLWVYSVYVLDFWSFILLLNTNQKKDWPFITDFF